MRPGEIRPVLHARPDWQGGWDCWMAQNFDWNNVQQFGPRPDEALNGAEPTPDNPPTANNEESDNEQHTFDHGATHEFNPGTQQSVEFLDPNQIHVLNDFNNNGAAAVTERPSLSASTAAPSGYVEATSMPSIEEAAAAWWEASQNQQPDALSGLQSQAAGDAMLPNGQDGPVGFDATCSIMVPSSMVWPHRNREDHRMIPPMEKRSSLEMVIDLLAVEKA